MKIYNPYYGWIEVVTENLAVSTQATQPTTVFTYKNLGGPMGGAALGSFLLFLQKQVGSKYIKGKLPIGTGTTEVHVYIDETNAQYVLSSFMNQNPPTKNANYSIEIKTSTENAQGQHTTNLGKSQTGVGSGELYR
jgi:hypothetical protein